MWKKITKELVAQIVLNDRLRNINDDQFSIAQISNDHKTFLISGDPITNSEGLNSVIGYIKKPCNIDELITKGWEILINI